MKISDGIYRLIDKETNELVIQGTRGEISKKLDISSASVGNIVSRGSLKYNIYYVCNLYRYRDRVGTTQELADYYGVTYHHVMYRQKHIGTGIRLRGYDADKRVYALYKGEEILVMGTAPEIINDGWTTPSSFYNFLYNSQTGKNAQCVVIVEGD